MTFLLDRILSKERSIQLDLPRLDYADDSVLRWQKIIEAFPQDESHPGKR
jgi:hypothetical protein